MFCRNQLLFLSDGFMMIYVVDECGSDHQLNRFMGDPHLAPRRRVVDQDAFLQGTNALAVPKSAKLGQGSIWILLTCGGSSWWSWSFVINICYHLVWLDWLDKTSCW